MTPLEILMCILCACAVFLFGFVEIQKSADAKIIDQMDCTTILYHIHHDEELDNSNIAYALQHPLGVRYYEDQYLQKCIGTDKK
jgi:hypothetical protein